MRSPVKVRFVTLSISLAAVLFCNAQAPTPAPQAFEVASVRKLAQEECCTSISEPGSARFFAKRATLALLVQYAFGVDGDQIEGQPSWMGSQSYDVEATSEGNRTLSREELHAPLQRLLADRFGLKVHHEAREAKGYALVLSKEGAKLRTSNLPVAMGYILPDRIRSASTPLSGLAGMVGALLHATVIDQTGIGGNYAFDLQFAPMDAVDSARPSLPTALQEQLGLRLLPQKVSRDILVIDHVNRDPTEN
jgi:uncharacterized protein (TIGR03435 family)